MRPRLALLSWLSVPLSALFPLAACGSAEKTSESASHDRTTSTRPSRGRTRDRRRSRRTTRATRSPRRAPAEAASTRTRKDTLYLYEPVAGMLTEIGKFTCLDPANIVRLRHRHRRRPHRQDVRDDLRRLLQGRPDRPRSATGSRIADDNVDYPNALSFVPAGTVDPTKEALVGYASKIGDNVAVIYVADRHHHRAR